MTSVNSSLTPSDLLSNFPPYTPFTLIQVREIYQNRIALEREYSGKLLLLANKAVEKKSKKIATLVLGEEPTKAWGEGDVKIRSDSSLPTL